MMRARFWKRWVHEYLPTIVRREKRCQRVQQMCRGDLVYICEPPTPRRDWKRVIAEEVFSGEDGVPRRAAVRTSDRPKLILRPASRVGVPPIRSSPIMDRSRIMAI